MRFPAALMASVALVSLSLAACGGGGGGSDADTVTLELPGNPDVDGYALKRNGQILGNAVAHPAAGDLKHPDGQQTYRAVFSFDLPQLPDGARIVAAEMSVRQKSVTGAPMGLMAMIVVDHIDMGPAYDQSFYEDHTLEEIRDENGQRIPLSTDTVLERKSIDVTNQVAADYAAGRSYSQYRVRGLFDTPNGDDKADLISFESTPGLDGSPKLIITYELP